jgi:Cu(I)/Ag(I) efflux system periplasmic protein CusF
MKARHMMAATFAALALALSATTVAAAELAEGEVRKIDKETNKLTLRHAEIKSLDMPAMTMVFRVAEPALLSQVKVGDKIRFRAEKQAGGYVVTAIEVAK